MASRREHDLHPDILPLALELEQKCHKAGLPILIYCTYRSRQEQAEAYAQGRTKPGKIITCSRPGKSKHNFTLDDGTPAAKAFDCVPLQYGKPDWDGEGPNWDFMVKTAKELGLKWGGDWLLMDRVHFEI